MLETMTPEQMHEWMAYFQVEPFGDEWLQSGTLAAVFYNTVASIGAGIGGSKLKDKDMRKPSDFMPGTEEKKRRRSGTTAASQMAILRSTMGM
jgi:hypothetical protein